jgi:hypothetical protein
MSEGSGGALFDSKQFAYLPYWGKQAVLVSFFFLAAVSGALVVYSLITDQGGEYLVLFISICQTAIFGLVFSFFIMLSRQDNNRKLLIQSQNIFYDPYLKESLSDVSIPALGIEGFDVTSTPRDIFGRDITMKAKHSTISEFKNATFRIWVGLNVHKFIVIYFVPKKNGLTLEKIREIFKHSFSGLEDAGYNLNFEEAKIDEEELVSIWHSVKADKDFLMDPGQKLYWAQDIAMGTESFLRTAVRAGIPIFNVKASPAPL